MSKVPISLIIDDGGVVNTFSYHDLANYHEELVPPAMAMLFGKLCNKYGVKGKFSVVPIPCCLGRLDEPDKVNHVPEANIRAFVEYAKKYIAPSFSITPELLTHFLAWNNEIRKGMHWCEDTFVGKSSAEEICDYISIGLQILDNIGLHPTGVSSPWKTGINNEDNYSKGIGMAFKKTFGADRCFYFLHSREAGFTKPREVCNSAETGRVITVPNNTIDAYWGSQNPATFDQAVASVREKIDTLLTADGKSGILRELYEANEPLVMITHWQSLYSDGRMIGLNGFEELLQRIQKNFGDNVEWMKFEDLAKHYCP